MNQYEFSHFFTKFSESGQVADLACPKCRLNRLLTPRFFRWE